MKKPNNDSIGQAVSPAADPFLSLPAGQRTEFSLEAALLRLLDHDDTGVLGVLFTDRRWLVEWLFHSARYPSRLEVRKRRTFMRVLDSTQNGRSAMGAGLLLLSGTYLCGRHREQILCFARELSSFDRSRWAVKMWELFSDTHCLYSTLDAGYINSILSVKTLSPSGSYRLLDGDEECQRLFFRVGFPYYARNAGDWGRYCRLVERNPWTWEHLLTLDMNDALLCGMVEYIHALPPSCRDQRAVSFLKENYESIRKRLADSAFLLGRPSDYACLDSEELSALPLSFLLRSGAVSYHLPDGDSFRCRVGVVQKVSGPRALVLCDDSEVPETRQVLYEDMVPGTPVVLWRDGVIALRRLDGETGERALRLQEKMASCDALCPGSLRYPVFEYRDMVKEAFASLAGKDEGSVSACTRWLGRTRLLDVMWRMSPSAYALVLAGELPASIETA